MSDRKPLFVRLPAAEAAKLDRASHDLRVAKKDLVTALVARAEFDELRRGDVLSVDCGVVLDGWVADAARTFPVGEVSPVASKLLEVTEGSLFKAVEQCVVGNRLGDVSHAIQDHVESQGFSIVRSLVGHGIGRSMHEEPQIPNFGPSGRGVPLEEGMVLAVEPMVTAGRHAVRMGEDGWAIYSTDGSLAAHFEFTVAITAGGPRILTPWHESKARVAAA